MWSGLKMQLASMTMKPAGHDAGEPAGWPRNETAPNDNTELTPDKDWSADEDTEMRDSKSLLDEDVLIAVMGVTGAGKSYFISQLTNEDVVVGHNLDSCTSEPTVYTYPHDGKTVRLIDTPGFDDTNRTDTDILKDIALFLSRIYSKKLKLAGIIYLHRITDVRMTGSSLKNVQMLEKLCGDSALCKVVLATTMWNLLGRPGSDHTVAVGEQREVMLKDKFWGNMVRNGSVVTRHNGDAESGQAIVNILLGNDKTVVLDIQREMVDHGLSLDQTSAGKFLQRDQQKLREKHERELVEAQASLEEAMKDKDKALIADFTKQQLSIKAKLEEADAAQTDLQIDYSSLVHEKDQQYSTLAAEMEVQKKARANEMRFIEQNLAELQDALDRQEKEHKEEIRRIMRSQNAKAAADAQRLTKQYEQQQAHIMAQIAAQEEERQRKAAKSLGRFFTTAWWGELFHDDDEEEWYNVRGTHHGGPRGYHRHRGRDHPASSY